jgi:hypothetical protein
VNGFYTCLLGNVVTALALTLPLWLACIVMTILALVCIHMERHNLDQWFKDERAKRDAR